MSSTNSLQDITKDGIVNIDEIENEKIHQNNRYNMNIYKNNIENEKNVDEKDDIYNIYDNESNNDSDTYDDIPINRDIFKPYYIVKDISEMKKILSIYDTGRIISITCEGIKISRNNNKYLLIIIQNIFEEILIIDLINMNINDIYECGLKDILEDIYITKLMWDGRRICDILLYKYNIRIENILDLQVALAISYKRNNKIIDNKLNSYDYGVKKILGITSENYIEFKKINNYIKYNCDENIWMERPLSKEVFIYIINNNKYLFSLKNYIFRSIDDEDYILDISMKRINKFRDSLHEIKNTPAICFIDFSIDLKQPRVPLIDMKSLEIEAPL
eukprot:GHVL01031969.1.p1 GENE.GHVL01031969.1~~GHVL01031969.1.p1  ORF type:complete len:332 (-),score=130.91 GHVL01031969.1:72-1067(-)